MSTRVSVTSLSSSPANSDGQYLHGAMGLKRYGKRIRFLESDELGLFPHYPLSCLGFFETPHASLKTCDRQPGEGRRTPGLVPGGDAHSVPYDTFVVGLAPTLLDYAHLNTAFQIIVIDNRPRG